MYQIRTHFPLCNSKAYCETQKDLLEHLDKIIKRTNKFRASLSDLDKAMHCFPVCVTNAELEEGMHVLSINQELLPMPVEQLLGESRTITNPVRIVEKIEKKEGLAKVESIS